MSTMERAIRQVSVVIPEPFWRMFAPYVWAYRWLRDYFEPRHLAWMLVAAIGLAVLNGGVMPVAIEMFLGVALLLVLVGARRWESERFVDALTGCANSRGMARWLRNCRHPMVVFYADLDDLHAINAVEGHAAGDRTLFETAWLLRAVCRRGDLVARLGTAADEFVVLLELDEPEDAHRIRERISAACEGEGIRLSLGYAYCRRRGEFEQAMGEAETGMRLQKQLHRCSGGIAQR